MKFEVLSGDGGRWYASSPDEPDLGVSGRSLGETIRMIPKALQDLQRKKQRMNSKTRHHEHLWSICKLLPEDYVPYGNVVRGDRGDCAGCIYKYGLESKSGEKLYHDWGLCGNPASHRLGLLTFEKQGCQHAVYKNGKRLFGKSPFPKEVRVEPSEQIPAHKTE